MNIQSLLKREKIRELAQFIEDHHSVWVYGAGAVCKQILDLLGEFEVDVEGVLITNKNDNITEYINGIRVHQFEKKLVDNNEGILVSVAPWKAEDILTTLYKAGIRRDNIFLQNIFDNYLYDRNVIVEKSTNSGYFSKYKELNRIGQECGTDKSSLSLNYLNKYEFMLRNYVKTNVKLLELGVYKGSSLRMWKKYFRNSHIVGADIDEKCVQYKDLENNIDIEIGDLSKKFFLEKLGGYKPTIILDDASHIWSHQIMALCTLFPYLESGGIYICEDTVTSFSMFEYGNFDDINISTYEFLQMIATAVSSGEPLRNVDVKEWNDSLIKEAEKIAKNVEMITFIHGSCLMIKR